MAEELALSLPQHHTVGERGRVESETRERIADVRAAAVRTVANMYRAPGDPDYNNDGESPRSKVPYRTALAGEYVGHMVRAHAEASGTLAVIRSLSLPDKEPEREFTDCIVVERKRSE